MDGKPGRLACDIIIPVWNQLDATRDCISYLRENTRYPYRLILIDNGSGVRTQKFLERLKETEEGIELIRNEENLGFVKAVNEGLKVSKASYVCVLNNDTLPAEGWLAELAGFAEQHPDVGLLNPLCKGHIEKGVSVNEYAEELRSCRKGKYMEMNQCQAFCMLIKRELIDKIGYLDERFGIGGFDDTDYSRRAQVAGYKCIALHSSYVYHREHTSFREMGDRKKLQRKAQEEYFKKWPRHLRVAMVFSVFKNTGDIEIENFLNSALFLAREWCWVNVLIFGDKYLRDRIEGVKKRINFPLHQNLKFNYLKEGIKLLEIATRVLERSFGTKKRKRYDALISGDRKTSAFLGYLCRIHKCRFLNVDYRKYPETELKELTTSVGERAGKIGHKKCDIILPVCDQYEFTKKCIESILRCTDTPFRLIIINNGKNPDTRRLLDKLERNKDIETAIVHNETNIGWVKALNRGIELSDAPYVCFQNDDTVVTRGWIRKMMDILESRANFGMINPAWQGRPRGKSIEAYNSILERDRGRFIETDWCRGFSVLIKRSVIERIGKVDEAYGLAYFDDVDYSVRAIEAGFLCLRAMDTYVYHHRNVSFFEVLKGPRWNELHEKNRLIYYKKWGRPLRVFLVIDKLPPRQAAGVERIADMLYYLARKQHRLYVWSPDERLRRRVSHTNIVIRSFPRVFLNKLAYFDLFLNSRKKESKRYDAVFANTYSVATVLSRRFAGLNVFVGGGGEDFCDFVKKKVDALKENTKGAVNASV